ncbi:MAG: 4a-hydroxytetrahydrobiopterin dehydratase [Flavobacteriaceae bacterium]|nr:4a-hydroxytetrahydrobiopterin dehydratase [Flavobacteriaceae bacterium]
MTTEQINFSLNQLDNNWKITENKLHIIFEFKDFKSTFNFMNKVALESEKINHHPLWTNDYNKLDIKLFTHDKGKITELDFKLAKIINNLL